MSFKYAAFLSYRHPEGSLAGRFVDGLYELLSAELELYIREPVFFDQKAFEDNTFSEQALAEALYGSVCMLFVYSPVLFDPERLYCAIEYNAMKMLQERRLAALPPEDQHHSLIIPIVLRGKQWVPDEIWNHYQVVDFTDYLTSRSLKRRKKYSEKIRMLAEYIAGRCEVFRTLSIDVFNDLDSFALPEKQEVLSWIRKNRKVTPRS